MRTPEEWSVPDWLPAGRPVLSNEGEGPDASFWLSDAPPPFGLWSRLRAAHGETGLWPLLLSPLREDDEFRPWGDGDVRPQGMTSPADHDPAEVLAKWWQAYEGADEWPGLAPGIAGADPDATADEVAEEVEAVEVVRLGLVHADRGADALTVAGWQGPANYTNDVAPLSAVVRSWEDRFGARVVSVGFATLTLSIAAPPTTAEAARAVAGEHFAFCPDNIWQGEEIGQYAKDLVNANRWTFWWD